MAENTKIEWTDHTFNPWTGCTKVSPACAHCYAEAWAKRSGIVEWGPGKPRRRTTPAEWRKPLKWDKLLHCPHPDLLVNGRPQYEPHPFVCLKCGTRYLSNSGGHPDCDFNCQIIPYRPRVFCASLADWLDDEVPIEWLADLLDLVRRTPNLDWLLLTKRPQNWFGRIHAAFMHTADDRNNPHLTNWLVDWMGTEHCEEPGEPGTPPANVWIGTTVEDQQRADERIPELLKIPAKVRFLSCEPLLGPIRFAAVPGFNKCGSAGWDLIRNLWVIAGGESGPGARPMHPDWARSLRDQCAAAGVPFLFKQWGVWKPWAEKCVGSSTLGDPRFAHLPDADGKGYCALKRIAKDKAGRTLDGEIWNQQPTASIKC